MQTPAQGIPITTEHESVTVPLKCQPNQSGVRKRRQSFIWTVACLAVLLLVSTTGCNSSQDPKPGDYGSVPRKAVPAELVGEWMYTQVSSTNIVSRNGHTVPTTAFGVVFHINPNGTGFEVISATVNT